MRHILGIVALASVMASCATIAGIADEARTDPLTPSDGGDETAVADSGPRADSSTADASPSPTAAIEVQCNDKPVLKHPCQAKRWEYDFAPCPAPRKVVLVNAGTYPVAYIARRSWSGASYVPDKPTDGTSSEATGVIAAGATVDISPSYNGGIFAIVGSVKPFDIRALTAPDRYEGRVTYAKPMLGMFPTGGELHVAELTASPFLGERCFANPVVFDKR